MKKNNNNVKRYGLMTQKRFSEDVEQFLNVYKTVDEEWTINGVRIIPVFQLKLDSAIAREPATTFDYLYNFGKIVRYELFGNVEIEEMNYTVVRLLETTASDEKMLALKAYCKYMHTGDSKRAAHVREKYKLKADEMKKPCAKYLKEAGEHGLEVAAD